MRKKVRIARCNLKIQRKIHNNLQFLNINSQLGETNSKLWDINSQLHLHTHIHTYLLYIDIGYSKRNKNVIMNWLECQKNVHMAGGWREGMQECYHYVIYIMSLRSNHIGIFNSRSKNVCEKINQNKNPVFAVSTLPK